MFDPNANPFKNLVLSVALLLIAGSGALVAGQVRVSPTPSANPKFKVLKPQQAFDPQASKAALDRGDLTIKGRVCSFSNGQVYWGRNKKVRLYPMTPYFQEWYRLREAKEDKNTSVELDAEVLKYRIDTETNSKAEFQFTEMRPGKYFIIVLNNFTEYTNRSVYAGSAQGTYGSADIYRNETYATGKEKRIEKIVELNGAQKTEKIILKSGFGGLIRLGTCGW